MPGYGMYPIKTLEYKQMSGRAGRPQYDDYGEALLIASSEDELEYLMRDYILSKPERIDSRLAKESNLRGHTLAAVASDYTHTIEGLLDFFGSTFYGHNYPTAGIRLIIGNILRYLTREGMLNYEEDLLRATKFGRRVSELYIDPLSAVIMRDGLNHGAKHVTDFTWLHLICCTPDMRPIFRPGRNDFEIVENYYNDHFEEVTIAVDDKQDYIDYENLMGEIKTAMVLEAWIKEISENDLLERFSVLPGDRYSAISNAEWLLYSTHELADVLGIPQYKLHLRKLRDRVKYGVTEKLLPLVQLKGIGRIRAQVLYNSGFTSIRRLKRANLRELTSLPTIGPRIAMNIKEQIGGVVDQQEWERLKLLETQQSALTVFIEEEYEDLED
jgi:helicase